ncbi:MAG TPA: TlpA disulfide reductase family protein [candidate division Zixibacteria bacterium]|nr:TlpA disulfide reductase family protein [candidate division Zixibacteria bacterium]
MVPVVLLGLLFGVLFGILSGVFSGDLITVWWGWPPVSVHRSSEEVANTRGPDDSALELVVVTQIPTSALVTRNETVTAPEFVLLDLFDESLKRSLNDYNGRPVILNFWASWCVPCKEEMPALQRTYEKYQDAGLVVLGVNQTFVDELVAARNFVNELALTFPNVRDDSGNISKGLYQVIGLPTSVFITPGGEIAHKQIGQMTDVQIASFSRQLVNGAVFTPCNC